MPDIGQFDLLSSFPADVLFWRPNCEVSVRHRNPLFSAATGISVSRSTAIDWLHTISLGVFQTYLAFTMQVLFENDAWRTRNDNRDAKIRLSVPQIAAELIAWQRQQGRLGRSVTEIKHLKPEHFGTWTRPQISLKAAETNWFLEYVVQVVLPSRGHVIPLAQRGEIFMAGGCLMGLLDLIRKHPIRFPISDVQAFHEKAKSYLSAMQDLGVREMPKDHYLVHLADRIRFQGSPALYGNWLDESLNRLLRDVAAGAHSAVHDRRVLIEFAKAHNNDIKRRRLA